MSRAPKSLFAKVFEPQYWRCVLPTRQCILYANLRGAHQIFARIVNTLAGTNAAYIEDPSQIFGDTSTTYHQRFNVYAFNKNLWMLTIMCRWHVVIIENWNSSDNAKICCRLKRLALLLRTGIFPDTTNFDFIFRMEYLETLSLHIVPSENVGLCIPHLTNFIVHLIHRCLHLKHLKLTSEYRSFLDFYPEIFEALVFSNLISFKTHKNLHLLWNTKARNNNQSLENRTLRVLCIPNSMYPEDLKLILSHFKNLKSLELLSTVSTSFKQIKAATEPCKNEINCFI